MKTKAVRMYGKKDLRLEEFELPRIQEDEILAHIVSDSICMSSYKASIQGAEHKRVPKDIAERPVIIGHEFCGQIVEVGKAWRSKFATGMRFSIQPAINYKGTLASPGYSYPYIGGDATYVVIPREVMEMDCLLEYKGEAFFMGSLSEPMSCIVGAFHASYHVPNRSRYLHEMGIKSGGKMAILAGVGPMGLGAIDYAIHGPRRPSLLVVTDINAARLERAAAIHTVEDAARNGVKLRYVNTAAAAPEVLSDGYDDVFVFAPVASVVEQADKILGQDGCLNFFAGPSDPAFSAGFNFYNVHYAGTHIVGTSGGNTADMIESLELMGSGKINPAAMITHIGGLNAVAETTMNLPHIPGGKKLIYTNVDMELTAISDFPEKGKTDPLFAELARIVSRSNDLWCAEAERYLEEHSKAIITRGDAPTFGAHVRKERGNHSQERQESAESVHVPDAGPVRDGAQHGRSDSTHSEGKAEKQSGDDSHASRDKLLSVDENRRERRGKDEPDQNGQDRRPEQIHVGKQQGEGRYAEDRDPDHVFAAHSVPNWTTEQRPGGHGELKRKEVHL